MSPLARRRVLVTFLIASVFATIGVGLGLEKGTRGYILVPLILFVGASIYAFLSIATSVARIQDFPEAEAALMKDLKKAEKRLEDRGFKLR